MRKRRWAYRPAYMPTQVPSVQPESRRDRLYFGPFRPTPRHARHAVLPGLTWEYRAAYG